MARPTFFVTNGSDDAYGVPIRSVVQMKGDIGTLKGTLSTAMDVLTADGASPTQAHVVTAQAAFDALNAVIGGDLLVVVNTGAMSTRNQLKKALDTFFLTMQGNSLLTS